MYLSAKTIPYIWKLLPQKDRQIQMTKPFLNHEPLDKTGTPIITQKKISIISIWVPEEKLSEFFFVKLILNHKFYRSLYQEFVKNKL